MAKCVVTGKKAHFGKKVSHSNRKSNKKWKPNLQKVRIKVNGQVKRAYVSTKALKSGLVERA